MIPFVYFENVVLFQFPLTFYKDHLFLLVDFGIQGIHHFYDPLFLHTLGMIHIFVQKVFGHRSRLHHMVEKAVEVDVEVIIVIVFFLWWSRGIM